MANKKKSQQQKQQQQIKKKKEKLSDAEDEQGDDHRSNVAPAPLSSGRDLAAEAAVVNVSATVHPVSTVHTITIDAETAVEQGDEHTVEVVSGSCGSSSQLVEGASLKKGKGKKGGGGPDRPEYKEKRRNSLTDGGFTSTSSNSSSADSDETGSEGHAAKCTMTSPPNERSEDNNTTAALLAGGDGSPLTTLYGTGGGDSINASPTDYEQRVGTQLRRRANAGAAQKETLSPTVNTYSNQLANYLLVQAIEEMARSGLDPQSAYNDLARYALNDGGVSVAGVHSRHAAHHGAAAVKGQTKTTSSASSSTTSKTSSTKMTEQQIEALAAAVALRGKSGAAAPVTTQATLTMTTVTSTSSMSGPRTTPALITGGGGGSGGGQQQQLRPSPELAAFRSIAMDCPQEMPGAVPPQGGDIPLVLMGKSDKNRKKKSKTQKKGEKEEERNVMPGGGRIAYGQELPQHAGLLERRHILDLNFAYYNRMNAQKNLKAVAAQDAHDSTNYLEPVQGTGIAASGRYQRGIPSDDITIEEKRQKAKLVDKKLVDVYLEDYADQPGARMNWADELEQHRARERLEYGQLHVELNEMEAMREANEEIIRLMPCAFLERMMRAIFEGKPKKVWRYIMSAYDVLQRSGQYTISSFQEILCRIATGLLAAGEHRVHAHTFVHWLAGDSLAHFKRRGACGANGRHTYCVTLDLLLSLLHVGGRSGGDRIIAEYRRKKREEREQKEREEAEARGERGEKAFDEERRERERERAREEGREQFEGDGEMNEEEEEEDEDEDEDGRQKELQRRRREGGGGVNNTATTNNNNHGTTNEALGRALNARCVSLGGRLPVHFACATGQPCQLDALLSHGVDPCSPDNANQVPIQYAVVRDHLLMFRQLAWQGADGNSTHAATGATLRSMMVETHEYGPRGGAVYRLISKETQLLKYQKDRSQALERAMREWVGRLGSTAFVLSTALSHLHVVRAVREHTYREPEMSIMNSNVIRFCSRGPIQKTVQIRLREPVRREDRRSMVLFVVPFVYTALDVNCSGIAPHIVRVSLRNRNTTKEDADLRICEPFKFLDPTPSLRIRERFFHAPPPNNEWENTLTSIFTGESTHHNGHFYGFKFPSDLNGTEEVSVRFSMNVDELPRELQRHLRLMVQIYSVRMK